MKIKYLFAFMIIPFASMAQEKLTIDHFRQRAVSNNNNIKIAEEKAAAATELRKAAFTAFLPGVNVNGTMNHQGKTFKLLNEDKLLPVLPYTAIDPATGQVSPAAFSNPTIASSFLVINPATGQVVTDSKGNPVFKNYTWLPASETELDVQNIAIVTTSLTQPIYTGGKIRALYNQTKNIEKASVYNTNLQTTEILYEVDESYWRVVSLQQKLKLSIQYKEMIGKLIEDITNLKKEGFVTQNDLLKAKVKLMEADLNELKANDGLSLSRMALCRLVGMPLDTVFKLSDSITIETQIVENELIQKNATLNRPELNMLRATSDAAANGVDLMKARMKPNVLFNSNYIVSNPNLYNGLSEEFSGDYTVGVVINIPIYHFGERQHTLRAAQHGQKMADLKLEETQELISLQAQQVYYQYTQALHKINIAQLSVQQAEENLRMQNDSFLEGMTKTTDVLEAQTLWQKAYSELIDARIEMKLCETNLKKVQGKTVLEN